MPRSEARESEALSRHLIEPVQAILFDLDGTLIDSTKDIARAANEAAERLGFPRRAEAEVHRMIGDGAMTLMARHLATEDEALIARAYALWREIYEEVCLDQTGWLPGIEALLDSVRDRKLAVVSNKPERYCRKILDALSGGHRFQSIAGGDSFATKKPSPEPLLQSLQRLRVQPQAAVMIGDGRQDVRAARAAGIRAFGVLWGQGQASELLELGADAVFEDPPALTAALAKTKRLD